VLFFELMELGVCGDKNTVLRPSAIARLIIDPILGAMMNLNSMERLMMDECSRLSLFVEVAESRLLNPMFKE
jgi:hypothetical protein